MEEVECGILGRMREAREEVAAEAVRGGVCSVRMVVLWAMQALGGLVVGHGRGGGGGVLEQGGGGGGCHCVVLWRWKGELEGGVDVG